MVRKLVVLVAVVCVATAAWAGPKDKSKGALVNSTGCRGTAVWNNEVVKATFQGDGAKQKVSWKGTGAGLDGKRVLCFLTAKGYIGDGGPLGNCLVLEGKPDKGKLSMKGLVASVSAGINPSSIQYDSTLACYVDASGTWDAQAACEASTGCSPGACLWIDQKNFIPPDCTDPFCFKDDNIVGVCENLSNGNSPCTSFPDTTPLAVMGIGSFPDDANVPCSP